MAGYTVLLNQLVQETHVLGGVDYVPCVRVSHLILAFGGNLVLGSILNFLMSESSSVDDRLLKGLKALLATHVDLVLMRDT